MQLDQMGLILVSFIYPMLMRSGVFYNLSTRATEVLSNQPPSPDFMDVTVGIVHERTAVFPAGGKTQVTQFEAFFCAGKSIAQRDGNNGHDLIDFEVTRRPDFTLPSSFEGTSGGSLWRFYLAMENSEPWVIEKRLVGVPFYQTHSQDGNRLLICQGPRSIYDKLAAEVAAVLGA
jgi:hypothetical protein